VEVFAIPESDTSDPGEDAHAWVPAPTVESEIGECISVSEPENPISQPIEMPNFEPVSAFIELPKSGDVVHTVVRELGSGRCGTVRQVRLESGSASRDLAVKSYEREEVDDESLRLFDQLITEFTRIDHPCLLKILRADRPDGSSGPVIWTEYVPSGSLDSYLKQVRSGGIAQPWSETQKVLVICGIVLGLTSLHNAGLFHGTLSPSNILLDRDSDFDVYIADYISYSLEHYHLTYSCLVNSPNYAPPECYLLEDDDFDVWNKKCFLKLQKVDAFVVGLIVYEVLTGQTVFSPDLSAAEIRRKTQSRDRPPIPGWIREDIRKLIDRCWDCDASKRPSIGEVWHKLWSINFAILEGVDSQVVIQRFSEYRPR
jgi:serine/threonine protein kinase